MDRFSRAVEQAKNALLDSFEFTALVDEAIDKVLADEAIDKFDLVEVVRCRDCKFKQKCPTKIFGNHSDDWFCADGERRDPCSSQDS